MTRLIADIGATNARFALVRDGKIEDIRILQCDDFRGPAEAAAVYLEKSGAKPQTGVFSIASADASKPFVDMTNNHWAFSVEEVREKIGLQSLKTMNDFTAIAYAMPYLTDADKYQIGKATPQKDMPIAIIGPGTGLGTAGVVFANGKPVVVTAEGGHVTMPSATQREFDLFAWLIKTKYSHVSAERVISGKGILNIYNAIGGVDGVDLPERTPADITKAALSGECKACVEVLDLFCHFLGVIAGNLALSYGAFGGLYIAGGIVPQLGDYFKTSRFYESYINKGRYKEYLSDIPVYVVTHPQPGLEGLKNFS